MNYSFEIASWRYLSMKKNLLKYFVLTLVMATMTASTAFASVNPSTVYQQQQLELLRQQNEALSQQNEYLRQQTESLRQQSEALKQSQAYHQGYIEGQGYGQGYRQNHYQLYTGMGLGYVMGQCFGPRYCHCWGRRYWH